MVCEMGLDNGDPVLKIQVYNECSNLNFHLKFWEILKRQQILQDMDVVNSQQRAQLYALCNSIIEPAQHNALYIIYELEEEGYTIYME